MEFLPERTKLFRADRNTNMTKLIVAFRKFANAPKILYVFRSVRNFISEIFIFLQLTILTHT